MSVRGGQTLQILTKFLLIQFILLEENLVCCELCGGKGQFYGELYDGKGPLYGELYGGKGPLYGEL